MHLQNKLPMPTIQDLLTSLHTLAPPFLAESYDNVGLLVGEAHREATGIMVSLDVTEKVLQSAKERNANVVIAHHPVWFRDRKTLTGNDYVSRTIIQALRDEIAIIAIHTNLDNIRSGVNDRIADQIGLTDRAFLRLKKDVPADWQGKAGSGLIGLLPKAMPKADFLSLIKEKFKCGGIRYADASKLETVHKVALCGGSGSFLIGDAIRAGADALVTADITYHLFFDADDKLLLLDIGHYESEQFTIDLLYDFLTNSFPTFALPQKTIFCEYTTNPVRYY